MKLFIVGGTSPTGENLLEILRRRKIQFLAPGDKVFDPGRELAIAKIITDYKPSQLVNLASYKSRFHSAMTKAEKSVDRCHYVQAELPELFAQVCTHLDIPMVHLSNASVFDGYKKLAYNENDEPNPIGTYGRSTLAGEVAVASHDKHIILRSGWLFGETKTAQISSWVKSARKNAAQLQVSRSRFSPTTTSHLATAILAICQQLDCDATPWGTYHYSGLETKKEKEFAELAIKYAAKHDEKIYGLLKTMRVSERDPKFPEIPNSTLSSKKLFDTFGIKSKSWHGKLQDVVKTVFSRPVFEHVKPATDVKMEDIEALGIEAEN